MDTKAPFAIQLDHINAICQAAMARCPRDPHERLLGRDRSASAKATCRPYSDGSLLRSGSGTSFRQQAAG